MIEQCGQPAKSGSSTAKREKLHSQQYHKLINNSTRWDWYIWTHTNGCVWICMCSSLDWSEQLLLSVNWELNFWSGSCLVSNLGPNHGLVLTGSEPDLPITRRNKKLNSTCVHKFTLDQNNVFSLNTDEGLQGNILFLHLGITLYFH